MLQPTRALPSPMPLERLFIPSLPTLDPAHLWPSLAPARPRLFPLDRLGTPALQRFYLARAAVYHALRHWLGDEGGTVLMPAYHHGVEVEAVRAAGGRVVFYRVDADLRVDLDDIVKRAEGHDVRVLYVTHYIGFAQPITPLHALAQARGWRLFEDCALSLFARTADGTPLGATGDAACFCLYKTLPVPHGGLLYGPTVPTATLTSPPLFSTMHHAAGLLLAHLELRTAGLGRALRQAARSASSATVDKALTTVKTGTMRLAPRELGLGASRLLDPLLAHLDDEMIVVRRRRNFSRLAAALDGRWPILGYPLPPGACPLFLPLRVRGGKRPLLRALWAHGIEAIDFWSGGDPACDRDAFGEVTALRDEVLELPCHQSLDDDDIDRLAQTVKQVAAHA